MQDLKNQGIQINIMLISIIALFMILMLLIRFFWRFKLTTKINWWTTNYYKNSFWVTKIILSTLFLLYFIFMRWIPDIQNYQNINYLDYDYVVSFKISKAFLLDWCPFFFVFINILAILDYKQKWSNLFGLIGVCFGFSTIIGNFAIEEPELIWSNIWKYVFIGTSINKIYFMLHCILCLYGFYLFSFSRINSFKKFKWQYIGILLILITFIIYSITITKSYNIKNNAAGFVEGDWTYGGQFYGLGATLDIAFEIKVTLMVVVMFLIILLGFYINHKFNDFLLTKYNNIYIKDSRGVYNEPRT